MNTPAPDYGEPWRANSNAYVYNKHRHTVADCWSSATGECVRNSNRLVACVNACAGVSDPAAHLASLNQELSELREWKRQQLEVENQWSCQKVGKMLGVQIGAQIRPQIEPKIANLNATIEQQAETLRVMNDALKEANRIFGNIGHSQVIKHLCPDFAEVAEKVRKAHDPHA